MFKLLKYLLKLRINYIVKRAFQEAEQNWRLGNGKLKLDFATNYISKRVILLPYFKPLLKEILAEEFANHSEQINKMIIREAIRI